MEVAYPLGLNLRFLSFAVLSTVSSVVLVSAIILGTSLIGNIFFLQEFEVPPGSGVFTEAVSILFLTILIGLVMALTALPLSLPSSVIVWFASLACLSGKVAGKWRIRISACLSGLAGSAGFILWVNLLDPNREGGLAFMLFLGPAVMVAALASAEFIYRPAGREMV